MAKKVIVTGKPARRIEVSGKPQRRIEPQKLAAALGAEPVAEPHATDLDPLSLAALGGELIKRLRSSGGRPALADATEICRVPLNPEDMKALQKIADQIAQVTGTRPSPGQVVSIMVHNHLETKPADSRQARAHATTAADSKQHLESVAACISALSEMASQARALQEKAGMIETTAKDIKEDIDRHVVELLALVG